MGMIRTSERITIACIFNNKDEIIKRLIYNR